MSDYKFKSIVAKKDRISTIVDTVYVPDEVVRQIKSEVIDSINDNIHEIYKCQFYCMEDMCEHDSPTADRCIDCFYDAIQKSLEQLRSRMND